MSANPQMIALVRDVRRLTQTHLAEAADVRQAYISMIEAGVRVASDETLHAIADALDCPVALLQADAPIRGGEAQDLHFRRRKTLPVPERRRLEGKLHLAYLTVKGLLRGIDYEPSLVLPTLDIEEIESPAEAARLVRRLWRIPTGPIPDLTAYLEAAGMFLMPCAAPNKVDAITRRCEEGWHVTAFNDDMPPDRSRLTRGHELGHLVLHGQYSGPEAEAEANEFAAELLTPAEEITPHLHGLTTRDFGKLIDLRLHWKVSVPFLVHRAAELGCISERQERSFYQLLNSRGLMRHTVDQRLPEELPTLLARIIGVHRGEHHYAVDDLAAAALMTPARFTSIFPEPGGPLTSSMPTPRPTLEIVRRTR